MENKINYYIALFVDVLGQGQKLEKIKNLPINDDEATKFDQLFLETTGAIKKLHIAFEGFFNSYTQISPEVQNEINQWDESTREKFLQSKVHDLRYLNFSDTVVLYCSLDLETNKAPMRSIYAILAAAAATFLIILSEKIPLRGAINIGLGTELEKSGIYGPILQNLHCLESKMADYPRIIIGEELIKTIDEFDCEEIICGNQSQSMDKVTISSIRQLITTDGDGKKILNYLDNSISKALSGKSQEVYEKLTTFINEQVDLYAGNTKLLKRYKNIQDYVQKNRSNWVLG